MKRYTSLLPLALLVWLTGGCRNDFLTEKTENVTPVESPIYVAPDWTEMEWPIHVPGVGNSRFKVTAAPKWLRITTTGEFRLDETVVTCRATRQPAFSDVGLYGDVVALTMDGRDNVVLIPVYYVNEGRPTLRPSADNLTMTPYQGYTAELALDASSEGILFWSLKEMPEWLRLNDSDPKSGILLPNHINLLHFACREDYVPAADTVGQIVLASTDRNHPELAVNVQYKVGDPALECNQAEIDFGRTETSRALWIYNRGNGLLTWRITHAPPWLHVAEMQGSLYPYAGTTLTLTCNRNNLSSGLNTVEIELETNDRTKPVYRILLKAHSGSVSAENIRAVEGTVTDAAFDRDRNLLYLSTAQPNQLLAYDVDSRTIVRRLALSKAPNCFSLSEDGQRAVIGHSGIIGFADLTAWKVTQTMDTEAIVYDIEWATDGWCCYTAAADMRWSTPLRWVHAEKNIQVDDASGNLYGGTIIRKIPNQNYIVATQLGLSPSSMLVFDMQRMERVNMFFTDIGRFWFSKSGTFLFDSYGNVYRTQNLSVPAEYYQEYPVIDRLKYQVSGYTVRPTEMYHPSTDGFLWAIHGNSYNRNTEILQFEMNDYMLVGKYSYDDYYPAVIDGRKVDCQAQAHYLFASPDGKEALVVKNILPEYGVQAWSIEHVPVR